MLEVSLLDIGILKSYIDGMLLTAAQIRLRGR